MFKAEVCAGRIKLTDVEGTRIDLLMEACGVVDAVTDAISEGDPAQKQRFMRLALAAIRSKELCEGSFEGAEPSGRFS